MPLGNGERYYSASLGRFTQQDSFSGVLGETTSLNRYSYGHNNPIINTDPSGHIIPLLLAVVAVGFIAYETYQGYKGAEQRREAAGLSKDEAPNSLALGLADARGSAKIKFVKF